MIDASLTCSMAVRCTGTGTNVGVFCTPAIANLVPRLFPLCEGKTLAGAGHVSRGFRVVNLI